VGAQRGAQRVAHPARELAAATAAQSMSWWSTSAVCQGNGLMAVSSVDRVDASPMLGAEVCSMRSEKAVGMTLGAFARPWHSSPAAEMASLAPCCEALLMWQSVELEMVVEVGAPPGASADDDASADDA
jgi:hypothetical protein